MNKVFAFTKNADIILDRLISTAKIVCDGKEKNVVAQWDTGASGSCISHEVAREMKLIPAGIRKIQTPSGTCNVNTYLVDVFLPNHVTISDVMVCDSEIGSQGIGMLVGMDIINLGDFAVSNYSGKTVFSFRLPSVEKTDYVATIKKQNLRALVGPPHGKGKKKKK